MMTTTRGARRSRSRQSTPEGLRAGAIDDGGETQTPPGDDRHAPVPPAPPTPTEPATGEGVERTDASVPRDPERWWQDLPLYDPADVQRAVDAMLGDADGEWDRFDDVLGPPTFDGGPEETSRLRTLRGMLADPRQGQREAIQGSDAVAARVAALRAGAPHFTDYLDLVERAILFSDLTLTPLTMPPVLLVGSPGIGKTHLLHRLAQAIGCAFTMLSMTQCDAFRIHGQNTCWRNARIGVVAAAMLESPTIQRLFLLDEFEKPVIHGWAQRSHDVWHQLLEAENAAVFVDEFLEVPMHLDRAFWVASANSLDGIPSTIIDRLLVLHVPVPGPDHMQAVVEAIYAETCSVSGGMFAPMLSAEVRRALTGVTPRRLRRVLALALPFTRIEQRLEMSIADVERAMALMAAGASDQGRRFGFVTR